LLNNNSDGIIIMEKNTNHDYDIAHYSITVNDRSIRNPYLDEISGIISDLKKNNCADISQELLNFRTGLVSKYAYSIPTYRILKIISEFSPILEIGAGSGYWAYLLSGMGAEVTAFDVRPPDDSSPHMVNSGNYWFEDTWHDVSQGDETLASFYPEHTLMLCWPPMFSEMASDSLDNYLNAGGKKVIYLGNPESSGDPGFYQKLETLNTVTIERKESWYAVSEWLKIYTV